MTALPTVPLGPHRITRLIVGGNPFCGNSHFSAAKSREMAAYYTPRQVVEVLQRCERAGVNTVQARGDYHRVLYWLELFRREGGALQWIAQTASEMHDVMQNIRILAAAGAIGIYHHGTQTDRFWQAGEIDRVEDHLKCMRDSGVQVGLGTHIPEVIEYAEERGWDVDFYMACLYNLSREPRESALVSGVHAFEREQYLPEDRERMCEVIRRTPKTCLAFKILAAGRHCATQEEVGKAFQYAFGHIKEQDAAVVGMYPEHEDQVTLNVAHTLRALEPSTTQGGEKEEAHAAV
jgi:hypothetical protein